MTKEGDAGRTIIEFMAVLQQNGREGFSCDGGMSSFSCDAIVFEAGEKVCSFFVRKRGREGTTAMAGEAPTSSLAMVWPRERKVL